MIREVLFLLIVLATATVRAHPQEDFPSASEAQIDVDTSTVTGTVSPYFFGQFIEHEHNTIQGGLWAELLHDRKFEQGDADRDGVSSGWVPEERIHDTYWKLKNGRGPGVVYFLDHQEFYGGGTSQGVELSDKGSQQTSVYQIGIRLAKGRRYAFYVYLKGRGQGNAFVELGTTQTPVFAHESLGQVSGNWRKYEALFTAPEDTKAARLRIGFQGHGTFWMDSASLMPADNLHGLRRDVVDALRPMRIPLMRYPGGCFADYYHWENGIGDRDKRPEVFGDAWQEWDPNDFGIDEFMAFAHELGFVAHLTADYVSATPEEAARWVEYMNGSVDTPMGRLRSRNGHSTPYGVKLWAVGNEAPSLCSQQYTGGTQLKTYVKRYSEFKSAMQRVDPSIRLMASSVGDLNWIHDLLKAVPIDLIAISIYTGQFKVHPEDNRIYDYADFYRKVVAEPLEVDRIIEQNIHSIGPDFPKHTRFFAISEINSWWLSERVDPDYRLANALYFSSVFNGLLRRADQIFTAEASTTLNVQGLLEINPVDVKLTPPYYAYVLYANHIGDRVVNVTSNSPSVAFNPRLPSLDCAATLSKDSRTLYVAVVNRSESASIQTTIRLKGWDQKPGERVSAFELNGISRDAANPFGSSDQVNIQEHPLTVTGSSIRYAFQPHSATVLQFESSTAANLEGPAP